MLEGPRTAVLELYEKISKDTRHCQTIVSNSKNLENRTYESWMAIEVVEPQLLEFASRVSSETAPARRASVPTGYNPGIRDERKEAYDALVKVSCPSAAWMAAL